MNHLKTFLPYLFGNKKGKSLEVSLPSSLEWESLSFEEILMFHALLNSLDQYFSELNYKELSRTKIFHLLNFKEFLNQKNKKVIDDLFSIEQEIHLEAIAGQALDKNHFQSLLNFKNNKLSVFAILNKDRKKPGRLVVRDEFGEFVKNHQGHVWSIPILGLSGRGLDFNHSNGCTPTGVYTIDSVMPEANKHETFGRHRRLIVNFIPESVGEAELLRLLPTEHSSLGWWKQSVVARDLGRHLLRIHGTGRKNFNLLTPYFPFVPTSGCFGHQ